MNVTTKLLHVITSVDRSTEGRLHDAIDGTPGRHTLVVGPASAQRPLARIVGQVEVIEMPRLRAGASHRDEAIIVAQLTKLARRRGYAIIHAHDPRATRIARLVAKAAKIPQVCVSTDLDQKPELARLDALRERIAAPVDTYFVETAAARERLIRAGVDASSVAVVRTSAPISDAVPLDEAGRAFVREQLGVKPDAKVVALLGRMDDAHGADVAHQVVADAIGDGSATLLLVGDGPRRAELLDASDDRVEVRAITEPGQALGVVRSADALLSPFRGPRVEVAQVQAAAADVPIVTYEAEGVAELFDRGARGRMVPQGDVAALADALRDVLANAEAVTPLDGAGEGNRRWNVWNKAVAAINYRWRYEPDAMRPIR